MFTPGRLRRGVRGSFALEDKPDDGVGKELDDLGARAQGAGVISAGTDDLGVSVCFLRIHVALRVALETKRRFETPIWDRDRSKNDGRLSSSSGTGPSGRAMLRVMLGEPEDVRDPRSARDPCHRLPMRPVCAHMCGACEVSEAPPRAAAEHCRNNISVPFGRRRYARIQRQNCYSEHHRNNAIHCMRHMSRPLRMCKRTRSWFGSCFSFTCPVLRRHEGVGVTCIGRRAHH